MRCINIEWPKHDVTDGLGVKCTASACFAWSCKVTVAPQALPCKKRTCWSEKHSIQGKESV